VNTYQYFDADSLGVNFDTMLGTLKQLPKHSIVLLHPCCHNPISSDLTTAQWDNIIKVIADRALIPFLDVAYQDFGAGMDQVSVHRCGQSVERRATESPVSG